MLDGTFNKGCIFFCWPPPWGMSFHWVWGKKLRKKEKGGRGKGKIKGGRGKGKGEERGGTGKREAEQGRGKGNREGERGTGQG